MLFFKDDVFVYLCVSTGLNRGQAMEEPPCVGASSSALHQLCLLVRVARLGLGPSQDLFLVQGGAAWDFSDFSGVEFSLLSKIPNCKQSLKQQINYSKS